MLNYHGWRMSEKSQPPYGKGLKFWYFVQWIVCNFCLVINGICHGCLVQLRFSWSCYKIGSLSSITWPSSLLANLKISSKLIQETMDYLKDLFSVRDGLSKRQAKIYACSWSWKSTWNHFVPFFIIYPSPLRPKCRRRKIWFLPWQSSKGKSFLHH